MIEEIYACGAVEQLSILLMQADRRLSYFVFTDSKLQTLDFAMYRDEYKIIPGTSVGIYSKELNLNYSSRLRKHLTAFQTGIKYMAPSKCCHKQRQIVKSFY